MRNWIIRKGKATVESLKYTIIPGDQKISGDYRIFQAIALAFGAYGIVQEIIVGERYAVAKLRGVGPA